MDIPKFVYLLPVDGHLGGSQFGAITNKAALNMWQKSLNGYRLSFILGIPSSGIARTNVNK